MRNKKQTSRLCPVCGERVTIRGRTGDGRIILTCGDAVWAKADVLGRISVGLHKTAGTTTALDKALRRIGR